MGLKKLYPSLLVYHYETFYRQKVSILMRTKFEFECVSQKMNYHVPNEKNLALWITLIERVRNLVNIFKLKVD